MTEESPFLYDAFLTHNWGNKDVNGKYDNHERVVKINQGLRALELNPWFDSERMEGTIAEKMCDGIDKSRCVVVFITKAYIEKVGGSNRSDNCQLEFLYSARKKTRGLMIAVVMEKQCLNPSLWTGQVDFILGGDLYIDFSDDSNFEDKVRQIYDAIKSRTTTTKEKVVSPASSTTSEIRESRTSTVSSIGSSTLNSSSHKDAIDKFGVLISSAATEGKEEELRVLLEQWKHNAAVINWQNSEKATALHVACNLGHHRCVHLLIDAGCDVNVPDKKGKTPTLMATWHRQDKCLELLIAAGADVNRPDKESYAPIYVAAGNGGLKCLQLLLAANADMNVVDKFGYTPAYLSAWNGHAKCLSTLLTAGALVNKVSNYGKTPAYIAALTGHSECLDLLIANKADLNIADTDGRTPYTVAKTDELRKKLKAAGARSSKCSMM